MVYDPVRDCEVPSPATSLPSHREPRKDYITPGSSFSNPGDEITVEANGRSQPPAFGQDLRSPTAPPPRSGSGGLKGLLNDEADPRRKSRTHRSSIPSTAEEEARSRPSFHRLLNDTPAPPVSKSKSSTSLAQSSSPSNPSPGSRNRHLDPHGFLTPAAPTSTQPRPSPGTVPLPLSYHEPPYPSYFPEQQAGPSQRRQSACQAQRPMLPPQDIPAQYYENGARGTPGVASLLLRSPSVSISPRSFHTPLPPGYGPPRPSSSSSASHPLAYQPPEIPGLSPAGSSRRLSDEQAYPPSSGPNPNGRRGSASHRSSSQVAPIYSRTYPQVRSPSPIRRTMYNPRRISHPSSLLRPIEAEEVVYLRTLAVSNNPLRRRKKRPLPPWSGPSPGADARDAPTESDSSYFPLQDGNGPGSGYHRSFSIAHVDRRGSVSSSTGRPPVTPGPSVYRPAFDERPAITPTGVPSSAENPRRRNTSGNGEANLRKRPSERDDEGRDTMRRKVSETHYVGNAEAVAYHCNLCPDLPVLANKAQTMRGPRWVYSIASFPQSSA